MLISCQEKRSSDILRGVRQGVSGLMQAGSRTHAAGLLWCPIVDAREVVQT